MDKIELAKRLGELKPQMDDLGKFLIDESCQLIDRLPEESLKKTEKMIELIENRSGIENADAYLERLHAELKKQLEELQKQVKNEALGSMRASKKKKAVWVIVFLAVVTGAVLALGVLSALEYIPAVWCNVIGVCDCAFGLIFFIYEYCDDKLNEADINTGDAKVIIKFYKRSGDISHTGAGSVNNTGKMKVKNITIHHTESTQGSDHFVDKLFKDDNDK